MLSFAIHATEQAAPSSSPNGTPQENTPISKVYGHLFIGVFSGTNTTDQLKTVNYKGGSRIPWGLGLGYHINNHFSVDGHLEYWGDRYERTNATMLPGTANNMIQIDSAGISLSTKYQHTFHKVNGYAGIGAGFFSTDVWITKPPEGLLTTQGAPNDYLLAYHLVLGGGYQISSASYFGIELRYRTAKVDFAEYTQGEVDIGGTTIALVWYGM